MSGRKCGNCRHYEPSPIWRSGWCRNPRLYGPQESHLVRQEELACAHRIGNYWEPVEADEADGPGEARGIVGGLVKPLRLFGPGPRLVAAASGPPESGRFGTGRGGSSGGGGAGGSGSLESSGAGRDREAFGGAGGAGGGAGRPPLGSPGGPGRPERTGHLPGQERIVSYQPEERYWTDYLRIALPVVGLLLMLGLFWFWAANLIGDDDDDEPPVADVVSTNTVPTATPTTIAAGNPTEGSAPTNAPAPTEPPEDPTAAAGAPTEPPEDPTEPPEDPTPAEPAAGDGFPPDTLVQVIDDNVNFRTEPRVADDTLIRTLVNGEELTVVSGPIEADNLNWYEVEDSEGRVGFVAAEYVDEIQ